MSSDLDTVRGQGLAQKMTRVLGIEWTARIGAPTIKQHRDIPLLALLFIFLLSSVGTAQDLDQERRIELMEKDIAELKRLVKSMASQIQMLKMQVKDKPSSSLSQQESTTEQLSTTTNSWVVRITSVTSPDTSDKERTIAEEKRKLDSNRNRLQTEKTSLNSLTRDKAWHIRHSKKEAATSIGKQIKVVQKDIRSLEKAVKTGQNRVAGLLRDIESTKRQTQLSGAASDGQPVVIKASGSASTVAKTLRSDRWYQISGSGRTVSGVLHIIMKTASQTEAPTQ